MQRPVRFPGNSQTTPRAPALWSRANVARALFLIVAAGGSCGCESGSFMPPVNPELRGDAGAAPVGVTNSNPSPTISEAAPEPARAIEVVLGQYPPEAAEIWKTAARTQAGFDKAKLKISVVDMESPRSKQAELVGEAVARHPRALVVETVDPAEPSLAQAIQLAQGQGIPVVLVGGPLAGATAATATKSSASESRQAPVVVLEPRFADSARQVVAATIRIAKLSELDPQAGALVVSIMAGDPYLAARERAIKDALKAAGITAVTDVKLPEDPKEGDKLVRQAFKAHPKIDMVFALEPASVAVVREIVGAPDVDRLIIAGVYTTDETMANSTRVPNFAAVAEFTPTRVLRKGITTAVALAQGKETPPLVDYRINVTESSINSSALKAQFLELKKTPAKAKDNH